jgi:phosphatidylglycerol---prolipoprotein diacylglyceryl transferase
LKRLEPTAKSLYPGAPANHYTPDMVRLPFAADGVMHGVFMGLGILVALLFYAYERRRRHLTDTRLWTIAGFAIAFGAIGSRLFTWDFVRVPSLDDWWVSGDRSVLAGLVGAWLGVHLGKRLTGYREPTGDLFAPAVALAMVFGRVGCLLTEHPGIPTGGAWGITLAPSEAALLGGPAGVGLHPSFAYEIVFHAVAFGLMWRFRDRLPRAGDLFICYVTAYALFRFSVEFVRGNELLWLGMSGPQWFLLAVLPLLMWRSWRVFAGAQRTALEGSAA